MFKRTPKLRASQAFLPHHAVKLIKGGSEYFDLLEKMIDEAKFSIHFQVYIYDEDETGKRIAHALIAAAVRGVKVYLMVDGYASKNLSTDFIESLGRAGIQFRRFEPIFKSRNFYFGRRLHHKIVVTDVFHSLVAGLNISDRYNDLQDTKAWLDWALYAEGEISDILARICIRRFKTRILISESTTGKTHLLLPALEKNCAARVRINDWVGRKREITNSYIEMFKTATSHIIIMSPYFLPGKLMQRRIKQAIKRGVKIKVIQAGISDIAISKYAERYMYRWLFSQGIEIAEYQKTVLHGKIAVCDGKWVTVGSYNLNNLSAYVSIELNVDVNDLAFARKTEERLEEIIKSDCIQVTEEAYTKKTSFLTHLVQKAAYYSLRLILFLFTFYFKQKE